MKAFGLARIGNDPVLRRTAQDEAVINLALAFSYGKKGDDGKRPTEWVDTSIWGKRAESLEPYLKKGGLVSVTLDELHIETYQGKNGEGKKLTGRLIDLELAGSKDSSASAPAPTPRQAPASQPAPDAQRTPNFADMDDSDIPF